MKYTIGVDIGINDATVSMLVLYLSGQAYILAQKSTYMVGEDKITLEMKDKIRKSKKAFDLGYIDKDTLSYSVSKILGWGEFDAEVFIGE